MTLGDKIKEYRTEHNISMDDFAKKSHISKAYVGVLESNRHPKTGLPVVPSLKTYKYAAEAMGIPFEDLLRQLEGNAQFPNDSEELEAYVSFRSNLTSSERAVLDAFNELDDAKQQQAVTFLNYLLSEQKSEKRLSFTP